MKIEEVIELAIKFRHELHSQPELTWEEENTAKKIRDMLDAYGIEYKEYARTGTVATLASKAKGKHIALRGDIDALPLYEDTQLDYSSKNDGCMHACGHDGHTATLMATAIWLKENEKNLQGPVSFIFQPAEEGGHGAKKMIDEGCLQGIDAIYGWHNWPAIPFGKAICPDGIVMAGNGTFHIDIHGSGGHSSQPEKCKDPILAASAIVIALQQIVSRQIAPQRTAVVSVTYFNAPSGDTTIPDKASIGGSIRVYDDLMRDEVFNSIKSIAENTAMAYGTKAEVQLKTRYSATINHPNEALHVRQVCEDVFGKEYQADIDIPIMASEDFSYYLKEIPGAFALIGSDDGEAKHSTPCHSVTYDFNDKLIAKVLEIFTSLVGVNNAKL